MKKVENYKLKITKKLKPYIRMNEKIIKFHDTEIEEYKFHEYKRLISINDIDINKIIVSNKFPFDQKRF